jgi:hypothetical protein
MRRARVWLVVLGSVVVVVAVLLAALPIAVRWLAARQLTSLTGQATTIADVDTNLFTGRVAITDLRVAGGEGEPALVHVERIDGRMRVAALLRGRLHLLEATVSAPVVHVVRRPDGTLNTASVMERLRAGPASEGPPVAQADVLTIRRGAVVFDDRALAPPRVWRAADIEADLQGLAPGEPNGHGEIRLVLAGAPARVVADRISLWPAHARLRASLSDLDLAPLAVYVPADVAVRLEAGRLTATPELEYDAEAGLRAEGRTTISDLVLARAGQPGPLVSVPALALQASGLTMRDGVMRVGRLDLRSDATVLDASRTPPVPYDATGIHLVVTDVSWPDGPPGRVTLDAGLPGGGRLEAEGTVLPGAGSVTMRARVSGVDVTLARAYLPARAPITVDRGQVGAVLALSFARGDGIRIGGDVTFADVVLRRRGQTEPFITHRRLTATIDDLLVRDGRMALGRVALVGAPTIIDGSVTPPQRFDLTRLTLTAEQATWPSEGPARVHGTATLRGGAGATLDGRVDPGTLAANARLTLHDVDVTRLRAYVASAAGISLDRGRAGGTVTFAHAREQGMRLEAELAIEDLALGLGGERAVTDPRLRLSVAGLVIRDRALTTERVAVRGTPSVVVTRDGEARRASLTGLTLTVRQLTWPPRAPADLRLEAALPESGTVDVRGRVHLGARTTDLEVRVADAALGPWAALLPLGGRLRGVLDATLDVAGAATQAARAAVTGDVVVRDVALGPPDRPAIAVARVEATGIDAQWPARIDIPRLTIERPSMFVVREADGDFPLRAMLAPRDDEAPSASPPTGDRPRAAPAPPEAEPPFGLPFSIGEIVVRDGDARFVDRTTTPFYSEELSNLAITVRGLTSGKGGRADVAIQGQVGADAALQLDGVVAPFGRPFFLEVSGELRRFEVPRTNPYLRRFLAWIARSGELTTKLHYRVVGEELSGTNEILVQRLNVQKADGDVDRAIGLPLALIVSVLKNPSGDIRLTVPVSGELGSPSFSLGDAIATALRNVLTRAVTAPFRAIGRVFQRDDEEATVEVDPLEFEPGSAVVTPDGARHLQRVADFLRASPYVRLTLTPAVTEEDLRALRMQAVTAQVQEVQREARLDDFQAAAARLFGKRFPDRPVPETAEAIVEALVAEAAVPEDRAGTLAARRLDAARRTLVESAGIEAERLVAGAGPPSGAAGKPRVDFDLAAS